MRLIGKLFTTLAALVLAISLATPAAAQTFSSVQTLNGSCAAPSHTFLNDPDSGFYLASAGIVGVCINGTEVGRFTSTGLSYSSGASVSSVIPSYSGSAAKQAVEGDLNLAAGAGGSTGSDPRYLAGVMGNIIRTGNLTATDNYVAGVVGKYDITGTNSSDYPKAGVIGEVGGSIAGAISSSSDGAFVAILGGDAGPVRSRAAYTVDFINTGIHNAGQSYFNYGLDLQGPGAHDGHMTGRYENGFIRLGGVFNNAGTAETVSNVCVLVGTAAATNGVSGTGAGNCGAGSLYIRQSGASSTLVINTNTAASPTWSAIP